MNPPKQPLNLPYLTRRIVSARGDSGLTQEELSKRMGFKDRQTLAAIETGQRRVGVEELLSLMAATGKDMEYFTDPFRLVGEAGFSYRASGTSDVAVDGFEQKVGGWLALWRHLGNKRGETPGALRPRLVLNEKSTFEEAQQAGSQVASTLDLGSVPAERLVAAIEEKLKILVLAVDMPEGVSGAAVQLASGDAILTNRNEVAGRRTFDLAHELFHVLTWEALPPERVDRENPTGTKAKRTEQLADNFAGALLMPAELLKPRWESRPAGMIESKWVQATANHFRVSPQALFWRMVALGLCQKKQRDDLLRKSNSGDKSPKPAWFSRKYLDRVIWGIDRGEVSLRRILAILKMDLGDFRLQCEAHGLEVTIGI
jgi:Zn-dependent peptidase ImmA (M78 family)/transcriptional regulator with XRE-family HTH domain